MPGATAEDFPSNIQAIRAFMRGCTSRPLPSEDYEAALCWNIVVQPRVRGALVTRVINSDDVLAELTKPVLMTQGRSDTVILPAMGDHILRTCRTSAASWYDDVGHMPFNLKYRPRPVSIPSMEDDPTSVLACLRSDFPRFAEEGRFGTVGALVVPLTFENAKVACADAIPIRAPKQCVSEYDLILQRRKGWLSQVNCSAVTLLAVLSLTTCNGQALAGLYIDQSAVINPTRRESDHVRFRSWQFEVSTIRMFYSARSRIRDIIGLFS